MKDIEVIKEMSGVRSDKKTAILIKWAAVAVGVVIAFMILIFGLKSCNNKNPKDYMQAGTKEVASVVASEPVTYDPDGFAEGDNMPKGMTKPAAKPSKETQPEETQPVETRPAETQAPSEMASPVEATMPSTVQPIITEEQQIAPTLEITKDAKDEISPSSGVIENVTAKDERIQPSQQLPPNQGGSNAGGGWEVNHPTQAPTPAPTPASSEKPTSPVSGTEEKGQATRGSSGSSKPQTTTAPKKLSIDSISYTPGAGTVNVWISGYDGQRVKVDGVTSNGDTIDLEYGRQLSGDRVNVKARVPSGTTLTEVRVSVGNINDSQNF